jgi:pimeloyl-ACP methyl ester carboxylesterase
VRQIYQTLVSREDDVTPRLAELTMPALVVHGEQDLAISVDVARWFADALPDGELVTVEGAGHAANLTHPDGVNPALEAFLARV